MSTTTIIHTGKVGGPDGELSASFMPEYSTVLLRAYVPSDGRRAPISIQLSDTAPLRELLNALEDAIEAEAKKRAERISTTPRLVTEQQETVIVEVSGAGISLPRSLYEEAAELVAGGKAVLAAALISKALPWLGVVGAKEVAKAIYEHQRSTGQRE
mgnify:CR=1 FL=1